MIAQSNRLMLALSALITIWLLFTSGCQARTAPSDVAPTATPTCQIMTPMPTATALFRATRISGHYNQQLILYVGDTFILDNLQDSISPVAFDPNVLRLISDPAADSTEPKMFQAIQPGTTKITADVAYPCPNSPVGCKPPEKDQILVVVTVIVK